MNTILSSVALLSLSSAEIINDFSEIELDSIGIYDPIIER